MPLKRIILEMGTGNDLYGEDYTKAAKRAVQDALHHSSIILFRSLAKDPAIDRERMVVKVAIGTVKAMALMPRSAPNWKSSQTAGNMPRNSPIAAPRIPPRITSRSVVFRSPVQCGQ